MAGKRKKTHWAVKRKQKKARQDGQDHEDVRDDRDTSADRVDRRAGFPESIHPGSYAALRQPTQSKETDADSRKLPPKKRYGLWIAFCGKNYSGMQMNEGVKTIEAELERALYEAGAIAECNYGFLQKVGWSRAARTDKGVHAAGQLVTAKLHVDEDTDAFMQRVNQSLPEDIRLMHMVTVTKNFNAKMSCDQRTYEYLAPSFIFAPRSRTVRPRRTTETTDESPKWPTNLGEECIDESIQIDESTLKAQQAYRMPSDVFEKLNHVLKLYEGTHNFHNFTSKLEPSSPKCKRYIISFAADTPFVENNMEWIRLRVIGQSFLLHHIRKMIGTAVEIVAGVTGSETIDRATQLEKMDLPKAPSVGLYLAQAHFEIYNLKMQESIQTSHPPLDLEAPAVRQRVEQFKREQIFTHIIEHEEQTRTYAKWLRTLDSLPFSYVPLSYEQWKEEKEREAELTCRAAKREAAKAARAAHLLNASEE